MSTLSWGDDALSVLHQFEGSKFVVYVEGKDDVAFWKKRFDQFCGKNICKVLPIKQNKEASANGKIQLHELMKKIEENKIFNVIAASDQDYDKFLSNIIDHPRIVYTYGYSFENSIYCPESINSFCQLRIRNLEIDLRHEIQDWLENELKKLIPLVALDILNEKHKRGKNILKGGSYEFMFDKKTCKIKEIELNQYIQYFSENFNNEDIEQQIKELSDYNIRYITRGHALSKLVRCLVKKIIKPFDGNTQIPDTELYENFVMHCNSECGCEASVYMKDAIIRATTVS